MKIKKIVLFTMLLAILLAVSMTTASATTHNITAAEYNGNVDSLQAFIDTTVDSGDTLSFVDDITFNKSLKLNKSLTIEGNGNTIAGYYDSTKNYTNVEFGLNIQASDITINGLKMTNFIGAIGEQNKNNSNIIISNTEITASRSGIYLLGNDITISNNTIKNIFGDSFDSFQYGGYGITLGEVNGPYTDILIANNTVSGAKYGIANYASNTTIANNTVTDNRRDGIANNYNTVNVNITGNIIANNTRYGISNGVGSTNPGPINTLISNNTISNNTIGINSFVDADIRVNNVTGNSIKQINATNNSLNNIPLYELIENLTNTVANLTNNITDLTNVVSNLTNNIDDLNRTVVAQDVTIGELNSTVNELNRTVVAQDVTIGELNSTVNELNRTVVAQDVTIGELNSTVNELNRTVVAQDVTIGELNSTVNELNRTVVAQDVTIGELNSTVNELNNTITTQNGTINNLEDRLAALEAALTEVDKTPVKAEAKIAISKANGTYNKTVRLNATLTDSSGKAIVGETVNFYLNGKSIGNNITNSKGIAYLTYTVKKTGKLNITAKFLGNSEYNAVNKNSTLTVPKYAGIKIKNVKQGSGKTVIFHVVLRSVGPDSSTFKVNLKIPKGFKVTKVWFKNKNMKATYNKKTGLATLNLKNFGATKEHTTCMIITTKASKAGTYSFKPTVTTTKGLTVLSNNKITYKVK
ncbi:Ig-like domain repeat protein [Methanobrevibacter filiformis]|uniref:Protein SlyX n=1 Tax=Methanobrevibacter filiformis TaxID=55758 RepID=A0A166EPY0_9EURY|nr:Ig-like domain repeat protein [Methanobrevibacter filiformis]KZX16884.1 protein SlyX [Methanobrevibacter filiformis]